MRFLLERLKNFSHPGPDMKAAFPGSYPMLRSSCLVLDWSCTEWYIGNGRRLRASQARSTHPPPSARCHWLWDPIQDTFPRWVSVSSPLNGSSINDRWVNASSSSPLPFIHAWKSFRKSCENSCLSQTTFGLFLDSISSPHSLPERWPECFPFQSVDLVPRTSSYTLSERMDRNRWAGRLLLAAPFKGALKNAMNSNKFWPYQQNVND